MSIEVRVPEEIADYKESIVAGLSIRQLVCGGIAMVCGVPTFLLLKNVNADLATYTTMAVTIPAFCIGFIKKDGYNFETYLKIRLYTLFSKNQRGYETDNYANELPIEVEEYRPIIQKLQAEKEVNEDKKRGENCVIHKEKQVSRGVAKQTKTEYDLVEVTEKSLKRARKTAYKKFKATAGGNRKEKQEEKEKAESRSRTKELPAVNKI
jgi:hypothetical protein